jgi:diguanylate cyclase (GGDEF)-like protein/PAS domain S-box-containing protein
MKTGLKILQPESSPKKADPQAMAFVLGDEPQFYRQLLEHIADGVYFVDRQRRIHYWNAGAEQISGFSREEVVGRRCQDGVLNHVDMDGRPLCNGACPLVECICDRQQHEGFVFLHHKSGRRVPVKVRTQPMFNAEGEVIGAVEIFSDATAEFEMRRRTEAMHQMAFFDHLTGLPNRRYVEMTLRSLLTEATPPSKPFGILLFDLDRLKTINDTYGHNAGDEALHTVGQALASALRPTDVVGRWGGDEYLAAVHGVNAAILGALARRTVKTACGRRLSVVTQEVQLSISAGATLVRPGESLEQLVKRADELLYRSKAQGGGRATME